ncbi:bacteriocin secretion accessory protein [Leuconostoc gelidum]|uniref:bacteriocin secretion accessory protein n=1 Tax=Leuconostoc gelidum TaxID=1244 RepID=UPI00021920E3|nr:bacteriocin secretion accessory protein [Leuconostoc gelidum]AFS39483.1 lactococcin A ABC transporter permease [Leuconostoc gelidum JB7]MBZ5992189.1 bacteriocin secretion accessory protein [Leuconostoc gelidum subsp. gelidum]USP17344.1 bacteriocin secretion accessory protein [Leuconostoc gelidum subsp. aenigmaticum]GMA67279.1 lactococcin A secretion protein LcnD-like [Leuconostoc gelidum subsp. gelidum]
MFDDRYLESGEFYHRRYKNFSTLIIIPIAVVLMLFLVFSLFAKREITMKTTGQIVPQKILATVQSTSNQAIDQNNLIDNQVVKKGDVLMTFQQQETKISASVVEQRINQVNERLDNLKTYQDSLIKGENQFNGADKFGYASLYQSYLAQVDTLTSDFQQQISDKNTADGQAEQQLASLKKNQGRMATQVQQYETVMNGIRTGQSVKENHYQAVYDSYQQQLKKVSIDAEKQQLKTATITDIQQQIDQLQSGTRAYDDQISSIRKSGPLSQTATTAKLIDLKQQQLASVQKESNAQEQELLTLKAKKDLAIEDYQDTVIKAPDDGILHVENDKFKNKYVSKGTNLAVIYPKLTKQTYLEVTYYVPTEQSVGLKQGQMIKFTANQNVTKPLALNGRVTKISTAPVSNKDGSYYQCTAKVDIPERAQAHVKYGLNGRVAITKGQKTWFNYYKDNLMGDKND